MGGAFMDGISDEISTAALNFEAVKTNIRQSKDGVSVTLAIDPLLIPADVYTSPVGTRYYVSMVEIGDDEQPQPAKRLTAAVKAKNVAMMLCRNSRFQEWLYKESWSLGVSEEHARGGVLAACGINKRSDLAIEGFDLARDLFWELVDQFKAASEGGKA
jgi:hypothetical protein